MVRLTDHAKHQIKTRGVSEQEVAAVLSRPAETVATRANRLASYALVQGKYIVVIHEKVNEEDVVVTAMRVDRRRLERLGFTQI